MKILSVVLLTLLFSCSHTQKVTTEKKTEKCQSQLDQQINIGVKTWVSQKKESPNRVGVIDIILPADDKQYKDMNKMAILAVSVIQKGPEKNPIKKIQFTSQQDKLNFNLPSIFPRTTIKELSADSQVTKTFGKYRQDLYLFIPVRFLFMNGKLIARFKNGVSGLELSSFPLEFGFLDAKWKKQAENFNKLPKPKLVIGLLEKYYCLGQ